MESLQYTAFGVCFLSLENESVKSLNHVWLFCDPMDCSPPGSSAHGIFQARMLEWVVQGIFPNPGIKLGSPTLQEDSLPSEPLEALLLTWDNAFESHA